MGAWNECAIPLTRDSQNVLQVLAQNEEVRFLIKSCLFLLSIATYEPKPHGARSGGATHLAGLCGFEEIRFTGIELKSLILAQIER